MVKKKKPKEKIGKPKPKKVGVQTLDGDELPPDEPTNPPPKPPK